MLEKLERNGEEEISAAWLLLAWFASGWTVAAAAAVRSQVSGSEGEPRLAGRLHAPFPPNISWLKPRVN